MKTQIITSTHSKYETIKRGVYAFQVLVTGVAIPVLFALGISNDTVKNAVPAEKMNSAITEAYSVPVTIADFHLIEI